MLLPDFASTIRVTCLIENKDSKKIRKKRRVTYKPRKKVSSAGKKKSHQIKAMFACLVTILESPLQSPASSLTKGRFARRSAGWSELRRLRAVSHTAPGRLRTLLVRHYGRTARSLAAGEWRLRLCNVRSLSQKTQPEAELRPQKPRRVPRRSAERRARPQARGPR